MATHEPITSGPFAPELVLEEGRTTGGERCSHAYYVAPTEDAFRANNAASDAPRDKVRIATITQNELITYPINVRRGADDYLEAKYGQITTLIFSTTRHFSEASPLLDPYSLKDMLEGLPPGCAKQFEYGLGLKWENRFIIDAISEIPEILEIEIASGVEESRIGGSRYVLSERHYHRLRRALASITERYQREAQDDKRLLAYNEIQHKILPTRFPIKTKRLRPNAIFELVKLGIEGSSLSKEDRSAAVEVVHTETADIARSNPQSLLSLKTEIEEVTLTRLIERFEAMLGNSRLTEPDWQTFFKDAPFVLSLVFAHPVFLVQDHAYVGGATIRGGGEKIADFLFAQKYTGNLAVIEIKRPSTTLLAPKPYRADIFRPSAEMSGAFSQVLDQRFRLQTNFATKAYESRLHDVHPYAVHCIVIAGTTPASDAQKKSLDLYRNASRDVQLVTFDELLLKLKEIARLLAARSG